MTEKRSKFKEWRNKAETFTKSSTGEIAAISRPDLQKLMHEVQVYQVELETQNEELRRVQLELATARDRYCDLYDFAPLGYITLDPQAQVVESNLMAGELLGVTRSDLIGGHLTMYVHESHRGRFLTELSDSLKTDGRKRMEVPIKRDYEDAWLSLEMRRSSSVLCRCILADVTARRLEDAHKQMLMAELDHRVKNTLSVVQAMANQTTKTASSFESFTQAFTGRINALADMQRLLTRDNWITTMNELVFSALKPHSSGAGAILDVHGPRVQLRAGVAQCLHLALHELATNAVKYGALSAIQGRLAIHWAVREKGLVFRWTESGGPPCIAVRPAGFGRKLLESTIEYELGGKVRQAFPESGMSCLIEIPLGAEVGH